MSTHDSHPFDSEIADHLLAATAGSTATARLLAQRLAVTTVPALASEVAGERQAIAAFRAAATIPPPHARRASVIQTTLAKLLTLKAAAILAALSAGGIALAATTGVLPNPLTQDPPAHSTPADSTPAPGGNPGVGTPSPSLPGLCTAYLARPASDHGKALESPAFQALLTAAGGAQAVDAFCADLAAAPGNGASPDHPTGPPTAHPSGPDDPPGSGRATPHNSNVPTPAVTPTPNHP